MRRAVSGAGAAVIGLLMAAGVSLAVSDGLGRLPEATSLEGAAPMAVPFDLAALKPLWRARIAAVRATGTLPILDIESSFGGGKYNPARYAKLMDEHGIALTAFSAEAGRWDERTRILMALDPTRHIPTTGAGIPPHWPDRADRLLTEVDEGVRAHRYPLMGEFEFRHYPSPRQVKRGENDRDITVPIDGPLGHRLFQISQESGVPFEIHYEVEDTLLPPLEAMLRQYPKAKVIWCHLAQIRYQRRSTIYGPEYVRRLLESHPNLYFDTAFGAPTSIYPGSNEPHARIWDRESGRGIRPDWAAVIAAHPYRFLAALDIGGDRMDQVGEPAKVLRQFLEAIPAPERDIVAHKAAWKLLFNEDL
jgi:Amidohydrolase